MIKREMAFVLSLSATITSPTFLWFFLWWREPGVMTDLIIAIMVIIPIMVIGFLFMKISKTKRGRIIGGAIILIMGIAGIVMSSIIIEEAEAFFLIPLIIPAVMAIAGGCLGIVGAREDEAKKRQYSRAFIFRTSLMGFIFALLSVFVVLLTIGAPGLEGMGFFMLSMFYVAIPLWVISAIFNAISTVVISGERREEIIVAKTLTVFAWCVIALLLVGQLFFLFFLEAL